MLAILVRIIGFIAPYSSQVISLLSGLSLKQIGYVVAILGLIASMLYAYNKGYDSCQAEITKAKLERANKNAKIRNMAVDRSVIIDKLRNGF